MKRFQQFLNCLVFEIISAVCAKQADIFKASFHTLKSCFYQPCRFMFSCTVTYDFLVMENRKYIYVCNFSMSNTLTYIRSLITTSLYLPVLELAVQDIQEIDHQHHTILNQRNQRPKDKHCGNVHNRLRNPLILLSFFSCIYNLAKIIHIAFICCSCILRENEI